MSEIISGVGAGKGLAPSLVGESLGAYFRVECEKGPGTLGGSGRECGG